MANNILIGPNSVVAKVTDTFANMGFNDTNVTRIYEIGNTLKSWEPNRTFNPISGTNIDKGYYIISLINADLTSLFSPDFQRSVPTEEAATVAAVSTSTIKRYVIVAADEDHDGKPTFNYYNGTALVFHYLIGQEYLIPE